jgi:hypothetical protein
MVGGPQLAQAEIGLRHDHGERRDDDRKGNDEFDVKPEIRDPQFPESGQMNSPAQS